MTERLRLTIRDEGGPPYEQLAERIRHLIQTGRLLPGDRVPPVRTCAEQVGLAPNTVARAYRELERDGWLVGRGRAGTFVARSLPARPAAPDEALARAAAAYLRRAEQLGFDRAAAARALKTSP